MACGSRLMSCALLTTVWIACGHNGDEPDAGGASVDGGAGVDGGVDAGASFDAGPVDCSTIMAGQDEYTPGLEKIGANGYTVHLMSASPAPPAKGDNTWVIHVLDDTGIAADGLTLAVHPWMPMHMHGTPIMPAVAPTGDPGQYELDPVNLFMPGIWETTIEMARGAAVVDEVTYTFCIDG